MVRYLGGILHIRFTPIQGTRVPHQPAIISSLIQSSRTVITAPQSSFPLPPFPFHSLYCWVSIHRFSLVHIVRAHFPHFGLLYYYRLFDYEEGSYTTHSIILHFRRYNI